ncbi:DnaJ domain-containing protein [Alphaproteobacteria bacterium]|nr:DnaJ domain-containing protein [Alphaproteobacteria bacterium]
MSEAKIPELKGLKETPKETKICDMENCSEAGIYPAPRTREELRSYLWFCLEHVRDYNKRWNYFDGLNGDALEAEIRRATTWERPSWKFGTGSSDNQQGASNNFSTEDVFGFFSSENAHKQSAQQRTMHKEERWAWQVFDMEPCAEQTLIKQHYKKLAKLNHPDRNQGDADAEERLKEINSAYTILKKLYPASDLKTE